MDSPPTDDLEDTLQHCSLVVTHVQWSKCHVDYDVLENKLWIMIYLNPYFDEFNVKINSISNDKHTTQICLSNNNVDFHNNVLPTPRLFDDVMVLYLDQFTKQQWMTNRLACLLIKWRRFSLSLGLLILLLLDSLRECIRVYLFTFIMLTFLSRSVRNRCFSVR